jgi:hypothetical protein
MEQDQSLPDVLIGNSEGEQESPDFLDIVTTPLNSAPANDEHMTNFRTLQAALVMSKQSAGDFSVPEIADKFTRYRGMAETDTGYIGLKKMVLDARANDDTEGMKSLMAGYINNLAPDKAKEMIVGMGGILREIQDARADIGGYHEAVIDSVAPNLDEETHNNMVVQQKIGEMAHDLLQSQPDLWSKVKNYGGILLQSLVWPTEANDVSNLTGHSMVRADLSRKWFEAWSALPAGEKERLLPELKQRAMDASSGNPVAAAVLLDKFTQPYSDQLVVKSTAFESGLVAAGIATPKMIAGMVRAVKRATNPITYMADAKKVTEAAKLNSTVLQDVNGSAAKITGVPRDVAATNAMPFKAAGLDPATYTDGIAGETMQDLRKREQDLADFMRSSNPLLADPLRAAEIEAAKEKYLGKWRTFADEPGSGFNGLTLKGVNELNMEAEITFGAKKTGNPLRTRTAAEAVLRDLTENGVIQKGEIVETTPGRFLIKSNDKYTFTTDDVGTMGGKPSVGPVQAHVATPSLWMAKLEGREVTSEAVNAATRAELGGAQLSTTLVGSIFDALKPIGKSFLTPKARASLKKVDRVLLQGDGHTELNVANEVIRGKVYTIDELRLMKLEDNEISAYYGVRRVLDYLYMIKNDQVRKTLAFRGLKRVDVEGLDSIGKPIDTAAGARTHLQGKGVEKLYNPVGHNGLGGAEDRAAINFENLYDQGYKLVKLEKPMSLNGEHYDYAFIAANRISELPNRVLNYKVGYVPKMYKNAFYFVKEDMRGTLNGSPDKIFGQKTLRMFDSKKEADQFLAKQKTIRTLISRILNSNDDFEVAKWRLELESLGHSEDEIRTMLEESLRGNLATDPNSLHVLSDREMSADQLSRESYGMHGGLFTSPRATHDILFGISGEVPKQFSAFESIQRYIQHVSNYYPRNEWRMAEQQRWMNTARKMNAIRPDIVSFREATESVTLRSGSPERASLEAYANWIKDQARIPTNEEVWLSQHMRSLAEWAEKPITVFGEEIASAKTPKFARNFVMNIAQKDPFAAGRAAAFHALLGWFNPAQLFVQAQGASLAFSLHPATAARDLRKGLGMTAVMYSDNPTYIRSVGKAMGLKGEEFAKMHELFLKAGLRDSIRATADHSAAAQSYGIGLKAIKDAADRGLLFYRRGELFNRAYSFSAATEKWLGENAGKTVMDIGDKELKDILDYTMHISMNMTRANRAAWQKGMFSLPTQFMQIQAKWVESMLPTMFGGNHKFSAAQRRKFMMMQFALYGAAGVPLGKYAMNYAAQQAGVTPEQLSPETIKYVNGGVWDLTAYMGLGANIELGGRGSITDGLVENMVSVVTEGKSLGNMFGAFGQVSSHLFQGIAKLKPLVANAEKVQWTDKEFAYVASELAKTASTWNNLTKAHTMSTTHMIIDNQGRVVVDTGTSGFSAGTIIGQALGFRPSEAKFVGDLRMANKAIEAVKKDYVKAIVDLHYNYLGGLSGAINNPKTSENVQVMMDYYRAQVDESSWKDIMESVHQQIFSGSDEKTKQILQWYKNYSNQLVDKSMPDWLKYNGPHTNLLLSGQLKEEPK